MTEEPIGTDFEQEVVIDIDDTQDPPPDEDDESTFVADDDDPSFIDFDFPGFAPPTAPTAPAPPREAGRSGTVLLQGKKFSPEFRDALREMIKLAGFNATITQGGFNAGGVSASGKTHDGDAVDLSVRNLTKEQVTALISNARKVGIAAWFRTKGAKWGTRGQGFSSFHIHGVPNGWGRPSSAAKNQATSYRNGKDGLKSQQADLGPGHVKDFRRQTWQSYVSARDSATGLSGVVIQPDNPSLPPLIAEDGDFGPQTIKRLQRQVRVKQDGDFGPVTKSAVRTWLRFAPGPNFDAPVIKALQGRVGVTRDGDFGPVTVKALQRFLNANRTH